MKSILSLAIALVALFSVSTASAQNCHQVDSKSSLSSKDNTITLTVKVAGLGSALNNTYVNYTLNGTLSGSIDCIPPGQTSKDPGSPAPGQYSNIFNNLTGSALVKNGSITITVTKPGPCNNNSWDVKLTNCVYSGSVSIQNYCSATLYVTQ